jgi:hypothetical protein
MEDVLEGSQRVHSRLIEVTRVEPEIGLASDEFRRTKSELIGETVKFIARENKLSLSSLVSKFFPEIDPNVSYNLKIVTGKEEYEIADYPVKWTFYWEMAKSFESNPEAPRALNLKIDPTDRTLSTSWVKCIVGYKSSWGLDGKGLNLSFSSREGQFISQSISSTSKWINVSWGHGHTEKHEFVEGMFSEIGYRHSYRISEDFIRDVILTGALAYGIISVPYLVPVPVPVNMAFGSPQGIGCGFENLEQK